MKVVIGYMLAMILGLSASDYIPSTSKCGKGELRFEPPLFGLGKTYMAPGPIYSDGKGLAASIGPLLLTSGSTYFHSGEVVQSPPKFLFGANQVLRLNNTVLNFDLRQLTQRVAFEYLDQGGTINLSARGASNMYIGQMYVSVMPSSMVINGVAIRKSQVQDFLNPQGIKVAEKGVITLTFNSDIGSLRIGGQELHLDNFCFN